ncbi:hypothetical protein A2313_02935 [Candidatus Roizmanbacteria bacterium RIFOXYB2_FULL_41_10]|nr:MAG: hypothetical protein A2262_03820 [Candidatus Roizmanbacteria bacterium RIFOXYA2_FULL_41_8]OGK66965.1 MAG: hypothetical protein A2377_03785 [Candidatus Roizmanbacteria bacterium RIFOXYB1_FULL_41_27]OGK71984.1 MAG: hypothetical protein A2403_03450 [Candidatus Roizmanbacteria bacterium RIFOXYC1_FULL_41_16]OGK72087.1 MAG: hypothetical protein A2313_02935 [Candidatus Roizmanbacteria bacterium RIFOXYB2_FULL_41_10]OGK75391.1 MAG: hypothetical protein A2575_02145 [Candidatus Roizmanbacteria bac
MNNNEYLNEITGPNLVTLNFPPARNKYKNMVATALSAIQVGDIRFFPVDQLVFGKNQSFSGKWSARFK